MYKCPVCGRIITEEQYIEEQEGGSGGYCYCEFSAIDENGEVWYPRTLYDMVEVKWWEMLDWNQMGDTWSRLSEEIKNKIRDAGLAPNFDIQSFDKTANEVEK